MVADLPRGSSAGGSTSSIDPSTWSTAERELAERCDTGDPCDLSSRPAEDRRVRAGVLRQLLAGSEASVPAAGLHLVGAIVDGLLDLGHVHLPFPLRFSACTMTRDFSLVNASVGAVAVTDCEFSGSVDLSRLVVDHLALEGSTVAGSLVLSGARVAGDLVVVDSTVGSPASGADALLANGLHVGGSFLVHRGVEIAGPVRLTSATIDCDLDMTGVQVTGHDQDGISVSAARLTVGVDALLGGEFSSSGCVRLAGAQIGADLWLGGAHIEGSDGAGHAVSAPRLHVGGSLVFGADAAPATRQFTARGGVWLHGAHIDGNLDLSGTAIDHADLRHEALSAPGIRIGGDARMSDGFAAAGTIRLTGATIAGDLDLSGAQLTGRNTDGHSVSAARIHIGGNGRLAHGFRSAGSVRLAGARVDMNLDFSGACIDGRDVSGHAVCAELLHVGGSGFFNSEPFASRGFSAQGGIWIRGARIDSNLELIGARITQPDDDGDALSASGARITGSAVMNDGFRPTGAVRLTGATVAGDVLLDTTRLTSAPDADEALAAEGLEVRGDLSLHDADATGSISLHRAVINRQLDLVDLRCTSRVDLEHAQCSSLADSKTSWPSSGRLELSGFRFASLVNDAGVDDRLAWLRRQGFREWSPDPYEHLAAYYRTTGDEDAARHVKIAKNHDELEHSRTTHGSTAAYRARRRAFGWLLGYGYHRYRAGWLLVATMLLAGGVFTLADRDEAMIPNVDPDQVDDVRRDGCGVAHECFNGWVYGADVVLPIIDFGQDSTWRPVTADHAGGGWRYARWAFIAIGWLLASIFVAGFTGLVDRR